MAKKPTLLNEAIAVLKAIKKLNIDDFNDADPKIGDPQMMRVGRRLDRLLNKAAQKAA